ncbi:MAG: anti-sigma factor, partial [Acidobacteriota bacterium]|nr:anti-sigma factor [Acidobacteriota bacterium]
MSTNRHHAFPRRSLAGVAAVLALVAGLTGARLADADAAGQDVASSERECSVAKLADAGRTLRLSLDGTAAVPDARGRVELERIRKTGTLSVEIDVDRLKPASVFGPEYLTYVAWLTDRAGTIARLGELRIDEDGGAELEVRLSEPDHAGVFVTAEPHFAVDQPSDTVVLRARPDNKAARRTAWS